MWGTARVSVKGCLHVSAYVADITRQRPKRSRLARVYPRFICRHSPTRPDTCGAARIREVGPCHSSCEAGEQSEGSLLRTWGRTQRSPWSEGRGPRGIRTSKARTGLRTRLAWQRRWSVYGSVSRQTPRWEPYAGKPHVRFWAGGVRTHVPTATAAADACRSATSHPGCAKSIDFIGLCALTSPLRADTYAPLFGRR